MWDLQRGGRMLQETCRGNASGSLRIAVSAVIECVSFCQSHVLVHEYDGKDLSGFVCLIALRLVEVQAGMKADFTCTCKAHCLGMSITHTHTQTGSPRVTEMTPEKLTFRCFK